MKKNGCIWFPVVAFIFLGFFISPSLTATDPQDVEALHDIYKNLGYPTKLTGWRSEGGDPCGELSWRGVGCNGTSVSSINLAGVNLSGTLGDKLHKLNAKILDFSSNNIQGELPDTSPHSATYMDFSCNNFTNSIPYSMAFLRNLHHLNLSHNFLHGLVGNMFFKLQSLEEMKTHVFTRI